MIIIKTKTGDIFVNDREMVNVTHNREIHTAEIHSGKAGAIWNQPPIEHVESVVYINEQTGKEWRDDGSELAYLHKENEQMELESVCSTLIIDTLKERLRRLGHDCVQWVEYYHENMPEELCKHMRNRGEEEKAHVNNNEDWTFRREWMQQHQKSDDTEADEVTRLNAIIEEQASEIRKQKEEIKHLEFNVMLHRAPIVQEKPKEMRSWWQRLTAWLD